MNFEGKEGNEEPVEDTTAGEEDEEVVMDEELVDEKEEKRVGLDVPRGVSGEAVGDEGTSETAAATVDEVALVDGVLKISGIIGCRSMASEDNDWEESGSEGRRRCSSRTREIGLMKGSRVGPVGTEEDP